MLNCQLHRSIFHISFHGSNQPHRRAFLGGNSHIFRDSFCELHNFLITVSDCRFARFSCCGCSGSCGVLLQHCGFCNFLRSVAFKDSRVGENSPKRWPTMFSETKTLNEFSAVVDFKCMADHVRNDHGTSRPCFNWLFHAHFIQFCQLSLCR